MPSPRSGGYSKRNAIYDWRVKHGKKEVFSHPQKMKCTIWIREHQDEFDGELRLIPPNY